MWYNFGSNFWISFQLFYPPQCVWDIIAFIFKFYTLFTHSLAAFFFVFFCKRCPLSRQGRPTGIRTTGTASSAPGRGFVRPPVCPTPPTINSYRGASGGQLTDCRHQMSSYVQYILFLCCCIGCQEWLFIPTTIASYLTIHVTNCDRHKRLGHFKLSFALTK